MSNTTAGRNGKVAHDESVIPADFEGINFDGVHDDFDRSEIDQYLAEQSAKQSGAKSKEESPEDEMIAEMIELSLDQEVEVFPWRQPSLSFGLDNRYSVSKILELDFLDGNPSIIAQMAKQASSVVQFPPNTAYLHGLGGFSAACVINFQVQYNSGFIPVGLYTLAAQPSGTGKSSIDKFFMEPIAEALRHRNLALEMLHANLDAEIEEIGKKAKAAKNNDNLLREYAKGIQMLMNEKDSQPIVRAPVKNITPQAAEVLAAKSGGVISVVSDEAEALDTYLGISYTDSKKSPDHGVFMAAFGGGRVATERVSRDAVDTRARGAFAVIAQNGSIDTMIRAGASGRGVSERCLVIKEPNMIGYRVFKRDSGDIDHSLKTEYAALCESVVDGKYPISLKMSEECLDMIVDLKNHIEPQCQAGGKYGDEQIKGFASKLEQHVTKLSAIFHIAENWNRKRTKRPSFEIQRESMHKAMLICMDLMDSYRTLIEAASEISGSKLVLEVIGVMKRYAIKGKKHFTVDKLRMAVQKEAWMLSADGKKVDFLVSLLLRAEEMNFCHLKEEGKDKKKWQILINPALKDFVVKSED